MVLYNTNCNNDEGILSRDEMLISPKHSNKDLIIIHIIFVLTDPEEDVSGWNAAGR